MKDKIRQLIKECVVETIREERMERRINQIISEEVMRFVNEDDDKDSKSDDNDNKTAAVKAKEKIIKHVLTDPKIKKSVLAYDLDPDGDPDTVRSEFSKKIRGERPFDTEEVNQVYQDLHQIM